ncbi:MAG TPA: hypothetical protein ENN41_05590, partial [Sediminispirochaeta sp.]|nr:hypothetical protein [Sediminispirochaeta sp.]
MNEPNREWTIHAFEGDTCCNLKGMDHILDIFQRYKTGPACAVITPRKEVPPELLSLVDRAVVHDETLWGKMEQLSHDFTQMIEEVVPAEHRHGVELAVREDFQNIEEILKAVWLVRNSSQRTREYISGLAATWIAQMFDVRLKAEGYKSTWLDSRKIITVHPTKYGNEINWEQSRQALDKLGQDFLGADYLIVTGGLASTEDGAATFLGKD